MEPFSSLPASSASASTPLWVYGDSSVATSSNSPRKTRSACNRCHSQKLRCVKKLGQNICERCLKLKTICRFGVREPRVRPSPKTPEQIEILNYNPTSTGEPVDVLLSPVDSIAEFSYSDWLFLASSESGLVEDQPTLQVGLSCQDVSSSGIFSQPKDLNLFELPPSADVMSPDINFSSRTTPNSSASFEAQNSNGCFDAKHVSPIQRLANLSVGLYECAMELPSNNGAGSQHSQKDTLFAIDELFHLTTDFIDVLKCFSLAGTGRSGVCTSVNLDGQNTEPGLNLDICNQQLLSPSEPLPIIDRTPSSRTFSRIDEGTILMIISCHSRLTEIFTSLFQMMLACIEYSLTPQTDENWAIVLPKLQLGSVSSPPLKVDSKNGVPRGKSMMYMGMITMLSAQLWEQVREVMQADGEDRNGLGFGGTLTEMVWDSAMDRTVTLLKSINTAQDLWQQG